MGIGCTVTNVKRAAGRGLLIANLITIPAAAGALWWAARLDTRVENLETATAIDSEITALESIRSSIENLEHSLGDDLADMRHEITEDLVELKINVGHLIAGRVKPIGVELGP